MSATLEERVRIAREKRDALLEAWHRSMPGNVEAIQSEEAALRSEMLLRKLGAAQEELEAARDAQKEATA